MKLIKLLVQRLKQFDAVHFRYYKVTKIRIDDHSIIKTEAQFCKYIYDHFGKGRYLVLAWQGGYEGFWKFWYGDIMENGYMREMNKNKEVERLKGEWNKADSYEEKAEIETEMEQEREWGDIEKKIKRTGPVGLVRTKPGIMHGFEEY